MLTTNFLMLFDTGFMLQCIMVLGKDTRAKCK